MINLQNPTSGQFIGSITEEQLQFLIDQLEEESLVDRDYAITRMTVDYLETQGASPELLAVLRKALDVQEEVLVKWTRA
jgi:processive 1,2-diacylglycerol beta-glucosyltransferase